MINRVDANDRFALARKRMVQEQLVARSITDERTLSAMNRVYRHCYVEEALCEQAYTDAPLSIGEGQTISQPYIVALMTQALSLTGHEKVLEVGTGCGYQTTILALLADKVYTVERFKSLAIKARQRFKELALKNIVMRVGDGSVGWREAAPFDRILLTCAAPGFPQQFVEQLTPQGILIVPCKNQGGEQHLLRMTKTEVGCETQDLGECRFVPMLGKRG
ncbi:MAG: hypothetical protein ACD_62C00291G0010 [uncultured bacterium]|nr:MAG: hypothetical protein ACD_62C00291G0010 [uncultured bacterium]